ncbi:hypothetical protein SLS60_002274 [Paraconiothyrium brasiliense]|uniref:PARP-type domain-containing protein n=1 Tax=Paraconiothyrium brasiliense TaxID=300254 RepID=A0ABR3S2S2_9PLEO
MTESATTVTATAPAASTTHALNGDDAPQWRVEHAVSGQATCRQASCKRDGSKIKQGELRVGTHTWHDVEEKYYWAWRHWGCATPHQIRGLKSLSDGEVAKVPGYKHISEESREQLALALGEGKVTDKEFKDIRPDLVKTGGYQGEIRDAIGYKVEVTPSARAGCRGAACKELGTKITKGELRLGILRMFDGEHASFVYKHWKCVSDYDLSSIKNYTQDEVLGGIDSLPKAYKAAVLESLEKGEVIVPPESDVPALAKKSRAKKKRIPDTEDDTSAGEAVPKKRSRNGKTKAEPVDDSVTEGAAAKIKAQEEKTANDDFDGTGTHPLRRSARQSARTATTIKEQTEKSTPRQSKRGKNDQAASGDKSAVEGMAHTMLEKDQKRQAVVADTTTKKSPKGKAKKAVSKEKRDRTAAATAFADVKDEAGEEAGEAIPRTTGSRDVPGAAYAAAMAEVRASFSSPYDPDTYIAELRAYMRENASRTPIRRY